MPETTPDLGMRAFTDHTRTRKTIFDSTLSELTSAFPVENDRYRLQLDDIHYVEPRPYTLADQKAAILRNRDLTWRLRGTWRLFDRKADKLLGEREDVVARVPYLTDRGTFIRHGNEYTVVNQSRLKPGAYARRTESGDLTAHVNVRPGTGSSFGVYMDPQTGKFRLLFGQARIPLYPILRSLGATDRQLRERWGDQILQANLKDDPAAVRRVLQHLNVPRDDQPEAPKLIAALQRMEMDPAVNKRTMGREYDRVTPELLIDASSKLVRINRGEAEPDDRDSLANQTVHSIEDFIRERIRRDRAGVVRGLLRKLTFRGGNLNYLSRAALDDYMDSVFTRSGLAMPLEEINPVEILDQHYRLVRLGEGGISSVRAVPDESRMVHPSHAGFVDPIRGPESEKLGVDSRIAFDTFKGDDNRLYARVLGRDGRPQTISAEQASASVLAFPGELTSGRELVRAFRGGKITHVPQAEVDFAIPSGEAMYSPVANMVPMMSGVKGGRLLMGAKMLTQALPLEAPEAPWVQSAMADDPESSFDDWVGQALGAVRAEDVGRVVEVTPDHIQVKYSDRTAKHELYDNFPFNRKTFFTSQSAVSVGDTVQPGQLLATSNFTDKQGTAALGRNLTVAYMPFRGLNYEDAVVISRAAANKLSSTHMHSYELEEEDDRPAQKNEFLSLLPAQFTRKQLDTMTAEGVVRPGVVVNRGDPLILALGYRDPKMMAALHRPMKFARPNRSATWDRDEPGVITDAV